MNIVVVGGGLSGWLTALYAQYAFPDWHIGVVESSKIGILGAGEGSTPSFISLLKYLDIDVQDMMVKTNATIKNGIRYIGWSEENPDYFHGFDPEFKTFNLSQKFHRPHPYEEPPIFSLFLENLYRKDHIDQFNFMSRLSRYNKIPIDDEGNDVSNYALHFDASLIAQYLKGIATDRLIRHFDNEVVDIYRNEFGNVEQVILEDGNIINTDFVFDCTGLHRLIIKKMEAEWEPFDQYLPMKKAIPFPIEGKVFPHTGAVAMNAGWMWQIPLQHRIGCGYVFDTNFISEEDARKELLTKYNIEAEAPAFNIHPGSYKNIWINNVLAIGLSAGFLEPLEASSIWLFTRNLERFFRDKNNIYTDDQKIKDAFNNYALKDMKDTADFIRLHYTSDKRNTSFWQEVNNYKVSDFLSELLEICQSRPLYDYEIMGHARMYWDSYYQIIFGNNIINKDSYMQYYENNFSDGELPYIYNTVLGRQDIAYKKCFDLEEYLEKIKNA